MTVWPRACLAFEIRNPHSSSVALKEVEGPGSMLRFSILWIKFQKRELSPNHSSFQTGSKLKVFSGQHRAALLWVEDWHFFRNDSFNWPVHACMSSVHRKCYAIWPFSRALRSCSKEPDSHLDSLLEYRSLLRAELFRTFLQPFLCVKAFSYVNNGGYHCSSL